MRVRIALTLDVDVERWMDEYGVDREQVRTDVRSYFVNQILASPAATDGLAEERAS